MFVFTYKYKGQIVDSKALIRTYVESVWNQCDLKEFMMITTPDYTYQIGGQSKRNREQMQQFLLATHTAFPDWKVQIVDEFAEDGKVTIRWEGHVTHQGIFNGIPGTGNRINVSGINIYHIVEGKIASEWEQTDTISMFQQMGIFPQKLK